MNLLSYFNWQGVNLITPYIGLFMCGYMMLSARHCTQRITTSTFIIVLVFIWLNLMWADIGHTHFVPTRQTMTARLLLLLAMLLFMAELYTTTKIIRALGHEESFLKKPNLFKRIKK